MSLSDFASTLNRKPASFARCLAVCLCLALSSCATYKPPQLPADQKATIYVSQYPLVINFEKMDGVDVALGSSLRTVAKKSLEVAPGRHTVSIRVSMRIFEQTYDGVTEVSFDAVPGKAYIIKAEPGSSDPQSSHAWIEETSQPLPEP